MDVSGMSDRPRVHRVGAVLRKPLSGLLFAQQGSCLLGIVRGAAVGMKQLGMMDIRRRNRVRGAHKRRNPRPTLTLCEKSPPAAPEAPQSIAKLYRAIRHEPGWPKGIVKVGGVVTICTSGDINRHAHAGTLVGVCDATTTMADMEAMV